MALHNIDKNSDDRGTPKPNTHDTLDDLTRPAHNTRSTTYQNAGSTSSYRIQEENTRISLFDASNNRVGLFGPDSTGAPVFKIAKPGQDASSATNDQLIFNSNQDAFKIVLIGTGTTPVVTATANAGTWSTANVGQNTYAHNLGYTPAIIAYINFSGDYLLLPYTSMGVVGNNLGTWNMEVYSIAVDGTNVYVDTQLSVYGMTVTTNALPVKYYLLQETAN